jgi:hypothetical protein
VDRLHELWLRLSSSDALGSKLHHRDVVGIALRRLLRDLDGSNLEAIKSDLEEELKTH